jgi:hypothetical protein
LKYISIIDDSITCLNGATANKIATFYCPVVQVGRPYWVTFHQLGYFWKLPVISFERMKEPKEMAKFWQNFCLHFHLNKRFKTQFFVGILRFQKQFDVEVLDFFMLF